jgi:putrescine transport system ATP-binding protein
LHEVGYNITQGVIREVAYLGNLTSYHIQLDSRGDADDRMEALLKVTHTNAARHDASHLVRGNRVYVWWCGSDVVVLTR